MGERAVAARLVAERTAAAQHLATLNADLDAVAAAAAGSNSDDEHDPEGSTLAFEREQLAALRANVHQRLVDLDAALERLRLGRYGECENCGRPISEARLEALPAARRCLSCAEKRRS